MRRSLLAICVLSLCLFASPSTDAATIVGARKAAAKQPIAAKNQPKPVTAKPKPKPKPATTKPKPAPTPAPVTASDPTLLYGPSSSLLATQGQTVEQGAQIQQAQIQQAQIQQAQIQQAQVQQSQIQAQQAPSLTPTQSAQVVGVQEPATSSPQQYILGGTFPQLAAAVIPPPPAPFVASDPLTGPSGVSNPGENSPFESAPQTNTFADPNARPTGLLLPAAVAPPPKGPPIGGFVDANGQEVAIPIQGQLVVPNQQIEATPLTQVIPGAGSGGTQGPQEKNVFIQGNQIVNDLGRLAVFQFGNGATFLGVRSFKQHSSSVISYLLAVGVSNGQTLYFVAIIVPGFTDPIISQITQNDYNVSA